MWCLEYTCDLWNYYSSSSLFLDSTTMLHKGFLCQSIIIELTDHTIINADWSWIGLKSSSNFTILYGCCPHKFYCHNYCYSSFSYHMQANFTIPTGVNNYRFVVQYNSTISFTPILQYVSVNRFATSTRYYANIINLVRDREYSISVRFEVSFSVCSPYYYRYTYMPGSYSDPITVRTMIQV